MLQKILKPTLLLDKSRVQRNVARMAEKAAKNQVRFRPHFKTHQSAVIGASFRAVGIDCITVSSVSMARYFAAHGWRDITIAFPVNLREIEQLDQLAATTTLHLLVESAEAVNFLAGRLHQPVGIWIEIDTGYSRSGVQASNLGRVAEVAQAISHADQLALRGLLTHTGQSYALHSRQALQQLYSETVAQMTSVRTFLRGQGFDRVELSLGDTPMFSVLDDFPGIDEMRPGNFIFYDATMLEIGACHEQEIAVAAACPIVAKYPERNEVVIYGGAVHLSKDFLRKADGTLDFGRVALLGESGWSDLLPDTYLRSLSQEHGVIRTTSEVYAGIFASRALGDLLAVLPVHSCLTADLHKRYLTLDGEWIEMMV